jgi:alpha-tubulin suppressor-like RCC1 family protein
MQNLDRILRYILPAALIMMILATAAVSWGGTSQIAAGASHTVRLSSDGALWASGLNVFGQLGDGSLTSRKTPVQVGTSTNWISVATGADHTLALKSDGSLWTWGANQSGQLGDSSKTNRKSPVPIGGGNWVAVAAGGSSSFALKADGTLWAWGKNNNGQLGNGDALDQSAPVMVQNMGLSRYTAVSNGGDHTLALQADGTLWAWGFNNFGQIGQTADLNSHSTPVQVGTDIDWIALSAGGLHSLALKADGTLWSWGTNRFGQLGIGSADALDTHIAPVQIGFDRDWSALFAGDVHNLAVKRNGTTWAWGDNSAGQLGDGTSTDQSSPHKITAPSGFANIVAVAAGSAHSIAAKANGEIYAWGDNGTGQLGNGTNDGSLSPVLVGTEVVGWVGAEAGGEFTAVRRSDGTLWTWGNDASGQLGDNNNLFAPRTNPAMVGGAVNWIAQTSGWSHTIALRADGTLWSWGDNANGQLGDGTTNNLQAPVQIIVTQPVSAANNWKAVSAGDFHTLALKTDGTLWAWGDNASGQLGDGTGAPNRSTPFQIVVTGATGNFDSHWVAISAGGSHSLALQADGTLWAWGDNSSGQLGSVGAGVNSPRQVSSLILPSGNPGFNSSWVAIAAGLTHSLALQANGTLWAWGSNFSGQLGNEDATLPNPPDQLVPVMVVNPGASFTAITAGDNHSVALKADGSLWSWGNNTYGQLGNGANDSDPLNPVPHTTPVRESTAANDWVAIAAGGSHTVALKTTESLWAWGKNASGQLGDGTTVNKNAPASLMGGQIDVTPSTLAFTVTIGATKSQNVTIDNKGTAPLLISSLSFEGKDSALFGTGGTCGSVPFTVAKGGSCTVAVSFAPTLPDNAVSATMTIASSDSNSPTEKVNLSGKSILPFTIAANAGANGNITGPATANLDDTPAYIIAPNTGFHVVDVVVNGVSKGAVTAVALPPVSANATITATFAINTYTITKNGINGIITGPATANHGDAPTYTITPAAGYRIADVMVDGVSQGAVTTVTLPTITANKVVTALFVAAAPALSLNPVTTPTNNKSQTLSGTVEAGATVTIAMGTASLPATVSGTTWSSVIPALAEGTNTITVTATGAAGTTTTLPPATITLDTIPPVTTATPAPGNYTDSVAVILATEAGSTIYYTTDGTPVTTASSVYSAPIRLAATTTNPFTVQFMAVDKAGNAEPVKNAAYLILLGCDLNGDGKVDVRDALRALQISVGMFSATPAEMMRGDVGPLVNGKPNPNGVIDLADALVILQRSVGLVLPW